MPATFQYFPFDTGLGANSDETRWGEMMMWMRTTGIITANATLDPSSDDLAVTANGTLGVQTAIGKAWVQGFYFEQDDDYYAIGVNPNTDPDGYDRIDLLTLQLDLVDDNIQYLVLEGTPAASPVVPTPEQDSDYWQFPLAQIYVPNGASVIISDNITDERVISMQGDTGSSAVSITSAGGTQTLISSSSVTPNYELYGLSEGTNITISETGGAITIAATGAGEEITLSSAGGDQSLVNEGTGPDLTIQGLSEGPNVTLTSDGDSVTIAYLTPYCRVTEMSSGSWTNGTNATITYTTNLNDPTSMHSTSVDTGQINIAVTGIYIINLVIQISYTGTPTGAAYIYIISMEQGVLASNGIMAGGFLTDTSCTVPLMAGDFVYSSLSNQSGLTVTPVYAPNYTPIFSVMYVGQL